MVAARVDIDMDIADPSRPHISAPALHSGPTSELLTPALRVIEHETMSSQMCSVNQSIPAEFGDLYRAGRFGAVVGRER